MSRGHLARRFAGLITLALLAGAGPAAAAEPGAQPAGRAGQLPGSRPAGWAGSLSVTQIDADPMTSGFGTRLSGGGRRALFTTLVPSGPSGVTGRLAVRDLPDGTPTLLDTAGFQLPVLSADGRFVGYSLPTPGPSPFPMGNYDVWVRNLRTGAVSKVSVAPDGTDANSRSLGLDLSATGRFAAFNSDASNLVDGDTNGSTDAFVRDLRAGVTTRVSVASDGSQANARVGEVGFSATGRYVLMVSAASNLVAGDTNGATDLFLHDTRTGTTTRVNVADDGSETNGFIELSPTVSADGRFVAFTSTATNLVSGDTNGVADVFVRDLRRGHTRRVSVGLAGAESDGRSTGALISAGGRYVAFGAVATNLVAGDTNGVQDVFVRDLVVGRTVRVSLAPDGTQTSLWSAQLDAISADGTAVAFSIPNQGVRPGATDNSTHTFLARPHLH